MHLSHEHLTSRMLPIVTAFVLFASGSAIAQSSPAPARIVARIDSLASAFLADPPVAGVSIAVVRGTDTLLMKGYGAANLEHAVPASQRTVYRIGSITKQFTAAAIMRLVDDGKISLDDPIGKYVPSVPPSWQNVPLRRLLNHTSGIRSYTGIGPRWQRRWREDMTPDTIVGLVTGDTLDFRPGTQYRYNNTGYVLLGMVIERASGKTYASFLEEEFYRPLGLSQTYYCGDRPIIRHRASGYDRSPQGLVNAEYLSMTQPFSAGALCSTVGDLITWQQALVDGRVVRGGSYIAMTTPEPLVDGKPIRYGYGLGVGMLEGRRRVSHGGGINGFATELAYYPDDRLHVVVLANTVPSNPGRLAEQVARVVLGLPLRSDASPSSP